MSSPKRQRTEEIKSLAENENGTGDEFHFQKKLSLEQLRKMQDEFCKERNWDQFHKPRNVLLAMVAEVGELAEVFQWKDDVDIGLPDFTEKEKEQVAHEMSDVLLYLVDLADKCKIDLSTAVLKKMEHNSRKYPVDKAYGKCLKYTAYQESQENVENEEKQ